ncbi:MAG: Flp family type IVb pilin [Pseudobdellovibrionaceae bacterium]
MIKNQRGQGLIEYLIIVSLVAVASIWIMRTVGNSVQVQFARINNALGGHGSPGSVEKVEAKSLTKKDLSDFIKGTAQPNTQGDKAE